MLVQFGLLILLFPCKVLNLEAKVVFVSICCETKCQKVEFKGAVDGQLTDGPYVSRVLYSNWNAGPVVVKFGNEATSA